MLSAPAGGSGSLFALSGSLREARQITEGAEPAPVGTARILVATAPGAAVAVGSAGTAEPETVGGTQRFHRQGQVKLLPDRLGQFKAIVVVEGHVHIGGIEGALTASRSSRLRDPGQVHQIQPLVQGKRNGLQATDALQPQLSSEVRPQSKAVAFQTIDAAVQTEPADDLEIGVRESESSPLGGDRHPGAV